MPKNQLFKVNPDQTLNQLLGVFGLEIYAVNGLFRRIFNQRGVSKQS